MTNSLGASRLGAVLFVAIAVSGAALADPATNPGLLSCATPPALLAIDAALDRAVAVLEAGTPLTIDAMGSSSTEGTGASAPAMSYPNRLERELKDRFPATAIRVINHGVGGQDVPEEVVRIDRDVIAVHPDLVIWQVGTNTVIRRDDLSADGQLIRREVDAIKEHGSDVILMDLQYAPRVLARPAWAQMEQLIADVAREAHVGLFRRFEIMREWDRTQQLAPAPMIGPDGLHMTDASYACLANQLAEALAWNWWSPAKLAASPHRSPDATAGIQGSRGASGDSRQR